MSASAPADASQAIDTVDCSVLVPVFNEERYIEHSVAAMRRQRFPGNVEFVFADGNSTDRTRELLEAMAREDGRIRVFNNPGRSVSSGLNVALKHARGHYVARMDAHTEYPDDYLANGVERLKRGDTRWVSGLQVPKGHGPVSRAVALALGLPLGRGGSRKWGAPGARGGNEFELDAGVFAGVWARSTLIEYGGWDEQWPRNSDSEMAGRFLARGEKLICLPAMAAEYVPRDTPRGLWRQYLDYGEFRLKTAYRHPHTLRRSQLLPPAVTVNLALALAGPRPLRPIARVGVVLYAFALGWAGIQARTRGPNGDAALVPFVLAIMHIGHGAGMLRGAVRHGIPLRAVVRALGLTDDPSSGVDTEPVFAPSLR